MDSKEFGLVAVQQLFKVEDLHYGFWDKEESPSINNFKVAQDKHTAFLFGHIREAFTEGKILDSGCGIGTTTKKLLAEGYRVDGLVPSAWMAKHARKSIKSYKDQTKGHIFECKLEDLPISEIKERYSLIFFSESYQYVNMQKAFNTFEKILEEHGKIIIFDFFKKDGIPGKSPLGGGHSLGRFYETVTKNNFTIKLDIDVTEHLSKNLAVVNEILSDRIMPFSLSLDQYVSTKFKYLYKGIKFLFRKKIGKLKYKYSSDRNAKNFEKYKSYRLILLERQ